MSGKQVALYKNFTEFYPFYLKEHAEPTNRTLHFIGTSLVILLLTYIVLTGQPRLLLYAPLIGYGFAWVGHFFFEKNKPATFTYPLMSLRGDFAMWFDIVTGKQPLRPKRR